MKSKSLNYLPNDDIPEDEKKNWKKAENGSILNQFIVKNLSSFPINFYVKITFKNGDRTFLNHNRWEKPLYIFPDGMKYPEVFALDDRLFSDIGNPTDKIVATFEYKYSPVFADHLQAKIMEQDWTFDLKKFSWTGPDGVEDIGLA